MNAIGLEESFRLAMRRLAASVSVLTLVRDGQPFGMAATAVCSLSFEPPSTLACINRSASLHDDFAVVERFGVNILAVEQEDIARRFSDPRFRNSRFEGVEWDMHEEDVPLIAGSQASIVCSRAGRFEHGSHSILIGQALHGKVRTDVCPLLYSDGTFARHAMLRP